jgi:anaerobic ribonucleoside-triphosphate reductase activating protein
MRVAAINYDDAVNSVDGPAISLWVCGCPHHCKGCHNEGLWDFKPKDYHSEIRSAIDEGMFWIKYLKPYLEDTDIKKNLAILGGEPLDPHNEIFVRNIIFYTHTFFPDRKIILWTGYSKEELENRYKSFPYGMEYLSYVTYLITDRFDIKKRDITLPLRGSSNQRIWSPYKKKNLFGEEIIKFKEVTDQFPSLSK